MIMMVSIGGYPSWEHGAHQRQTDQETEVVVIVILIGSDRDVDDNDGCIYYVCSFIHIYATGWGMLLGAATIKVNIMMTIMMLMVKICLDFDGYS